MTATDEKALLTAIREFPEEDTPRMMYADYLDELPAVASCPNCEFESPAARGGFCCGMCNDTGVIESTRNADTAALIRWCVKTGRHYYRSPDTLKWAVEHSGGGDPPASVRVRGKGGLSGRRFLDPPECWRALDQVRLAPLPGTAVHLARGFAYRLDMPCAVFVAHAPLIFASHPVTAVRLTDAIPRRVSDRLGDGFCWTRGTGGGVIIPDDIREHFPPGGISRPRVHGYRRWLTPKEAVDALSVACVAWGRKQAQRFHEG